MVFEKNIELISFIEIISKIIFNQTVSSKITNLKS